MNTKDGTNINDLVMKLHPLERKVLPLIENKTTLSKIIKKTNNAKDVEVVRALQWLSNKKIISLTNENRKKVVLDTNGIKYLEKGLPEKKFLKGVISGCDTVGGVIKKTGMDEEEAKACVGILKRKGCIDLINKKIKATNIGLEYIKKESFEEKLMKKISETDSVFLDELKPEEKFAFDNLKKRKKIIKVIDLKEKNIELLPLGKELKKIKIDIEVSEKITKEDIKNGSWKKKKYRFYDVTINVPEINPGKQHFVNEAIDYIKSVWISLGFEEMNGGVVQNAFWDLDVLFVPQDHPAREMQDTFYISDPERKKVEDLELLKRVKSVHETGGKTNSEGWKYKFSVDETEKLMLRTHTTTLSAHTLREISLGKKSIPGKYFSVGKVFRNESLDWKHLFEFYQVEGIVVDPNANFRYLLGYLKLFFKKLGYEDVRVRPAHFPYTEPSVEVEGYNPERKEWVELGGAGIFRPEVTITLLGEEIPVLAWGIGMERSITEYFNIKDLREIYGNDIHKLKKMKKWVK